MKKSVLSLAVVVSLLSTIPVSATTRVSLSSLETRINELQLVIDNLQILHANETSELQAEITRLNNEISALEAYDSSLDASISDLENVNLDKDKVLTDLVARLSVLESAFKGAHVMFVTSESFSGNLGGLEGADLKCQTAADHSAVVPSGKYRAWLSDSNTSVNDRFEAVGSPLPFVRRDGVQIALNWDDLLSIPHSVEIDRDENSDRVIDLPLVWSATDFRGNGGYDYGNLCNDWRSDAPSETRLINILGSTNQKTSDWSSSGYTASCDESYRLYCVQQ